MKCKTKDVSQDLGTALGEDGCAARYHGVQNGSRHVLLHRSRHGRHDRRTGLFVVDHSGPRESPTSSGTAPGRRR